MLQLSLMTTMDFASDIPKDGPATVEMKDDKDLTACRTCGIPTWKVDNKIHKVYENIPAKEFQHGITIDEKFPEIAEDPRNLRLGISADGVDINKRNRHHSVWPVLTVIYNLPPWLWVDTYDVSTKDNFNLRVVVLWTINDYLALGTLCGFPYSGFKGCVVYGKDTNYVRLFASSKQSYVGHKRYLPYNQPFRKQKKTFNGQQEFIPALIPMTGEQIYNEVQHIENKWGKGKRTNNKASENQEDVRGREKNVAESLVRTLLHVLGKMNDRVNARLDLVELGVKPELFAMQEEGKTTLPPAGYTLTNAEKRYLLNKPKRCIAEETIAEETIEFFSKYHKSMETIGIPPDKHEADENKEGKPLLASKSSEVFAKLFQKAHFYVIQNTDEIVSCIERHKQVLKTENPGKRIAFLENGHNKSFAKWLRKEVKRELAISKESVLETVRWISYGPHATVVKYDAYNINGYTFRMKCHDGKVYQNSGVSVEATDLHISKEVATTRQAFYYGVLQEIWVLDYRFRQIPLFKCDWVMIDKKLSIVFKTPPKNYIDTYDEVDEEFSTVIHQRNDNILPCVNQRDLGNESRDDYYRTDYGGVVI
ncbi:hypothetical protein Tco_0791262 [Tanacetum coccineum]